MKTTWFLLKIEWLHIVRQPQQWLYPLIFFVMLVCLFPIALAWEPQFLEKYMPYCLWIAILLTSVLSIENLFHRDKEEGYLEQLCLLETSLLSYVVIKLIVHWAMIALPIVLLTPVMGGLFHFSKVVTLFLGASLLLGTIIFMLLSGLIAALTISLTEKGVFLGLLFLPLVIPVMMAGAIGLDQIQSGQSFGDAILLLSGMSLIFIVFIPFSIVFSIKLSI